MAKLFASEMAGRVADRAVQIFGGRGYMTENPAERYYRELRVDRIWEGTSEIQRSIIARGLLKRGREAYTMDLVGRIHSYQARYGEVTAERPRLGTLREGFDLSCQTPQ